MKFRLSILTYLLCSIIMCTVERDNPLDERGENFFPPEIVMVKSQSNIPRDDTIHFDSGSIYISGNMDKCRFQVALDNFRSDDWKEEGTFTFRQLAEGRHVIHITSRYSTGSYETNDSIIFFVTFAGYRPACSTMTDTAITAEIGTPLLLNSKASGADTLHYEWRKNDSIIAGADSATLVFSLDGAGDADTYVCLVENRYGKATSRRFIVSMKLHQQLSRKKITYDNNSADSGSVPVDKRLYAAKELINLAENTGNIYKKDFTFAGWSFTKEMGAPVYSTGTTITMDTSDITLYAVWTKQPLYQIYYSATGAESGQVPKDSKQYLAGTSIIVRGNIDLAKNDSLFDNWSRTPGSRSKVYKDGDTLIIGTADTLFALWKEKTRFTITYNSSNATEGTLPADSGSYTSGTSIYIKSKGSLNKTGFTFVGWSADTSGSGHRYFSGDPLIFGNSNITLYAVWNNSPTYTITYENGGAQTGDVPIDSNNYEAGQSLTVQGNNGKLKLDQYTFVGWSLVDGSSVIHYNPGDLLQIVNKNLVLYAVWTDVPTFTVTYFSFETTGLPPQDEVNYQTDANVTVKGRGTLLKTGYNFTGWNTKKDSSGTTYLPDSTFKMGTKNDTLYALWVINTYAISFNARNGNAAVVQTVKHGDTAIKPSDPTRTNYSFDNWYADSADGRRFDFSTAITVPDTLFAQWILNSYTVSFDAKGGNDILPQTILHGGKVEVPTDTIRTGHNFKGWYKDSLYVNKWEFTIDSVIAPVTLYAKWTAIWAKQTNVVKFDPKGGSSTPQQIINYGGKATPPQDTIRIGYDFNGWYKETAYVNKWNFATDSVIAPITLYAKWTIKDYQIVFNTMGGSLLSSIYVNHGSTVTRPDTVPKLQGYVFDNWYKEASGTNLWNFGADTIKTPDTIFAKWTVDNTVIAWGKVENPTANCPISGILPEYEALGANSKLPDPFMKLDGTRISNKSQWGSRREEIRQQLIKYVFGDKPIPASGSVTGTVTTTKITVNVNDGSNSCSFQVTVNMNGATQPAPSIISYGVGATAPSGVAKITFAAVEGTGGSGAKTGPFYTFYGSNHPAGYLVAQAWQISRIIDVMEQNPGIFDPYRVGLTGCSRNGKGAFIGGVLDNRVALTIPCESGIGGTVALRLKEQLDPGDNNTAEWPYHAISYVRWLSEVALGKFATANNAAGDSTDKLPVDMHEAMALIAPRAIYIVDNPGISSLDPKSAYVTGMAGKDIFKALGVGDNFAYEGAIGDHCTWHPQCDASLNAMIDKFLLNKTSTTTGNFNTNLISKPDVTNFYNWDATELPGNL